MSTILNQTRNLIRLYHHHAGRSEIPTVYHLWSSIALISACVADKVYYRKFADTRLIPNLYVLLVGPSGTGKGTAINIATKFVASPRPLNAVQPYQGNITKQALIDEFAKRQNQRRQSNNLWLISPELGDDIPPGPLGEDLIRFLTKIYEGDFSLPIKEKTRLRGLREIIRPCLNWLAGTTKEWLTLSLPKYAVEGGSLARVVAVMGDYDTENRITRPQYPFDRGDVVAEIHRRVEELCYVSGEFEMSPEASAIDEQWYLNRSGPSDESLLPAWKRQHDLVIKIAMILSLAEGELDLMIRPEHLTRAQQLTKDLQKKLPDLIQLASPTKDSDNLNRVVRMIQLHGQIPRHTLMQRVSKYGITADKLNIVIQTLATSKQIVTRPSKMGGVIYVWQKNEKPKLDLTA